MESIITKTPWTGETDSNGTYRPCSSEILARAAELRQFRLEAMRNEPSTADPLENDDQNADDTNS